MRRAGLGDLSAFELVASRHDTALLRFATRTCSNPTLAEDAVQEALLNAWRDARNFRGESAVKTWLFEVLLHGCRRLQRRRAGEPVHYEPVEAASAEPAHAPAPDDLATRAELGRALDAALQELSEGDREILLLRDVEELSGDEVARLLELKLPAMKSRLHRARLELKRKLEGRLGQSLEGRS